MHDFADESCQFTHSDSENQIENAENTTRSAFWIHM